MILQLIELTGGLKVGKKIQLTGNVNAQNNLMLNGDLKIATSTSAKDYDVLINKPQINGVELIGNKLSADIHVQDEMNVISEQDIDRIIYGG